MNAAQYYDSVAPLWESDDFPEEHFARHVAATLSIPQGGGFVLDVGCGNGAMFSELGECGACEIVGIDVSEKMVALSRSKAARDPRIHVYREDFYHHMDPDYDVIMAFNVYDHFLDPVEFLYRAHILLRRGGRLTVAFASDCEHVNILNRELPAGLTRKIASPDREALLWEPFFHVDCICDNEWIYLISGRSR